MKILVTAMTALIVIGVAFLVYGMSIKGALFVEPSFFLRATGKAEGKVSANLCVPFGSVTLNQAPGTRITAMVVANRCLILQLDGGDQGERVMVVDLVAGRVLGTVTVESAQGLLP